jgi:hypothetical protein
MGQSGDKAVTVIALAGDKQGNAAASMAQVAIPEG